MARTFFRKIGIKLIAVGMVLTGLLVILDLSFRSVIETVNAYECHEAVSRVINDAILAEIESENADYSMLVNLTANAEGEIVSIESNVMNINRLKSRIVQRLEYEIEQLSDIKIQIPVGTLLGIQFLHGKGFDVGMTVQPVGFATASVISEFSDAGINQTLHRIIIEIDAEVDAVIPGYSTRVPVTTTVVAAETVIVGRVPDAYTHVVASENLSGYLNDYGAN